MVFVWEDKMRVIFCLLFSAVCVLADTNGNIRADSFVKIYNNIFGVKTLGPWGPGAHRLFQNLSERLIDATRDQNAHTYLAQRISIASQRGNAASVLGTLPAGSGRNKPFVADAVGNTLPPPSNVPATVGSPISLLTPDRYEFYTFDESGELVKRLMTLQEIQAIVAAGEESESIATFANDNQPTIAFNFSQPPYTKVHSVVTNVQNVLKAQMEAHKNRPPVNPTLDTPDVSDSWSLILPSIFGNSGTDIVPDKPANSFIPETDTIEQSLDTSYTENILSKEDGTQVLSTSTMKDNKTTATPTDTTKASTAISTSTTTTTTTMPTTTLKVVTTAKPLSTTTRRKLLTTTRARTTTTKLPTTARPTTTTTTVKPLITTANPRATSTKATIVTRKQTTTISTTTTMSNDIPTAKPSTEFQRISTFIPISTAKYVTEKVTQKPVEYTTSSFVFVDTTSSLQPLSSTQTQQSQTTAIIPTVSTSKIYVTPVTEEDELEKNNLTTITTQSVSPSTTVSSTEFLALQKVQLESTKGGVKDNDEVLPIFDVAQSISQIASDLGNNYQPIPTSSSNLIETTKLNTADMESKENIDMEIPNYEPTKNKIEDNFIKISTIDPHPQEKNKTSNKKPDDINIDKTTTGASTTYEYSDMTTPHSSESTTMDPILSESMGDLLSQVVNEAPQAILDADKSKFENNDSKTVTTEKILDTTTDLSFEISSIKYTPTTASKIFEDEFDEVNNQQGTQNKTIFEKEVAGMNESNTSLENSTTITKASEIVIPTSTERGITTYVTNSKNKTAIDITKKEENFIEATTGKMVTIKETTETFAVLEKEIAKTDNFVINGINKETDKRTNNDNLKDYVKIAVSGNKNTSNIEPNNHKDETVKLSDINNNVNKTNIPTNQINDNANQNQNVVSDQKIQEPISKDVNSSPKLESTTKPSKSNNWKNKTASSAGDKINITNNKDKFTDQSPKIDEFKKKIQKVNDEEMGIDRNDPWKLIPTVTPPKGNDISNDKPKPDLTINPTSNDNKNVVLDFSNENQGLEVTTKDLGEDIAQFVELCNELAFRYWATMVENIDKKRSFVLSPYSITSMLAMLFMGAKGATSGEMNEILKLDDMVTFNPHFTLKNISDSIESATNSGIVVSAFVRELFSDRNKGKILTFYKERAQHFYSGHVEEINFKLISDIIRRRTNLLVKKHTWGKISEYMKMNSIVMKPPLAAFSTNIYQTDCTGTSVDGRDGEIYFVVSPNVRQRRLVPVPAVVYRSGFLAGYDPVLDATAAALGNTNSIVSTMFLMPGQQGNIVQADDLVKLEQRLLDANPTTPVWNRVLRTLLPRIGLELQIPRFSHKSVFNVSSTLREMGLKDLFDANHADLGGLNGPSKDLYLSDMIQMTSFVTCGEGMVSDQHHVEEYPEVISVARRRTSRWADWDEPRDYQRAFHDPHDVGEAMHLPLHLRPRQARLPTRSVQPARLKFDRPFLFFVRHNPSGMILYVGRYNPRLLP